jgi:hypothetical protein
VGCTIGSRGEVPGKGKCVIKRKRSRRRRMMMMFIKIIPSICMHVTIT